MSTIKDMGTSGHAERLLELTNKIGKITEHEEMVSQLGNYCQRRSILLVEDDEQVAGFIEDFITKLDLYDVCKAATCAQARELFIPDKYFAIILDLQLDGSTENGIKLACDFRQLDDNVFIAVVTGFYPVFDARLIETVDDLMGKPVDSNCLQSKLFMWSIKYNRRKALKCYFDERLIMYSRELAEIRGLELSIKTKMVGLASALGMLNGGHEQNNCAAG